MPDCTVPAPLSQEMQVKINNYNEELTHCSERNGVVIVNTTPMFKLSTGELHELCFNNETRTAHHLNRLGVIRLLNTIAK